MSKCFVTLFVLCLFSGASAQSNLPRWSQQYSAYQSVWPKTKLHLIFNQDKFSPGDTAWFKCYFLTEQLTGVTGKQLLDLNLIDSRGVAILHFLFDVSNGVGQNQIALPENLSPGIYLVTAHSSWMKNFDPAFIFKKEIVIVQKNTILPDKKPGLRAAVEGGHLVGNVPNKIVIGTDRPRSSMRIIDAAGQEIVRATADSNGDASAVFNPRRNTRYFVQIVGDTVRVPLPVTADDGCALQLTYTGNEEPVKLRLASPQGSMLRDQELSLIVSSRGKIVHTATVHQGANDSVALLVPQGDLPQGIAHLSILNRTGVLLASRDFYSPGKDRARVKIVAPPTPLHAREKVRLEVLLTDMQGKPLDGEFAVSVLNDALFDHEKQNSLADELTVLSDVKERFTVHPLDTDGWASLDNKLILGTEEIPWEKILSGNTNRPRFPFTTAIRKTGKAYFADTHLPVPDFTQIMFYLQEEQRRFQTITEKEKVDLAIPDLYGKDEFLYLAQTNREEIMNLLIEWDDEPIALPRAPASKETDSPDAYATFVSKSRLIYRSYGFFSSHEQQAPGEVRLSSSEFEGEVVAPDVTVNVQRYVLLPTMEELIREVIPSLFHRKYGANTMVRVDLPEPMVANSDPVYVIDGRATRNTAFFLSLKPADLLTVKIVKAPQKLLPLGLLGKNGIVIVQTRQGDARETLADLSRRLEGLNKPRSFTRRMHGDSDNLRKPDVQSTLYWNPSVKTDANGKAVVEFYCSDDIGKMDIRIDGLAAGGRPFSATQELEVVETHD